MSLATLSESLCFGGTQAIHRHDSQALGCPMRFGVYLPPQAQHARVPVAYWLSGLTCTEENFITKAGAQRVAAELGLAIVTCDTSPRGLGLAGEAESWDFGLGAGFYVDARATGIFGHSMGGHGALVIALRNPGVYRTVSAFAPIASPMRAPWGEKALGRYLGADRDNWREYDATELVRRLGWEGPPVLVDQGTRDPFIADQLKPELLREAFAAAAAPLQLRLQEGYDHSYFFIASFVEDHLRHHARAIASFNAG